MVFFLAFWCEWELLSVIFCLQINYIWQNKCVYHLFVSFYLLFTAFFTILKDVIFSCLKMTQHFPLPKMSIYAHMKASFDLDQYTAILLFVSVSIHVNMTADMATINYFLCMPKILSNCYVRFPHTKNDAVFLFDA